MGIKHFYLINSLKLAYSIVYSLSAEYKRQNKDINNVSAVWYIVEN